jgi:multisubunit Na+/H+ antiporter MnhG subunit
MTTINWNDAFFVAIAALILLVGFIRSKDAKNRVSTGTTLTILGILELAFATAGYVLAFLSRNNPNFHADYLGQTVFLPSFIVFAIASTAYGAWLMSTKTKLAKN